MSNPGRVSELLLLWEEGRQSGRAPSIEELCDGCPDLADELRRRIAALESINDQLDSLTPSTRQVLTPGTKTPPSDRYRLEELLGRGAFGEVWRAFDQLLQRPVAIKRPRPDRSWSREHITFFLAEARKVARLEHPNIAPVYDVNQDGGTCFIVSRLIDGTDLGQWLQGRELSPTEAATLIAEVAAALHFAHSRGLVHRDIKPPNILVDSEGRPFLTDFGLAATEEEQLHEETGVRGTLPYMAPEQARGTAQRVDGRADVYSLGVVFYELLTGKRPFIADDWLALRELILTAEPRPPRSIRESVPAELERICLKCLAKRPTKRYASAADLAADLRRNGAAQPGPTPGAVPSPQEEPRPALHPLNFSAELTRLRQTFVGREWLDAELERWLQQPDSRLLLVTGDPGTGKSAYLAHVVGKYPEVIAHHFCVAGVVESLDALRFVLSIAAQIAERRPDYRQALSTAPLVETVTESDAGAVFRRLVADPLRSLPPGPCVLIVLDALDEAMTRGPASIARLIAERGDDLPRWVRLVVSSRKQPDVLDLFSRVRACEIEVSRPENLQDVASYLTGRFHEPGLRERLRVAGADPEVTARLIAARGAGNFLYVTQAVEAIQSGQIDPTRPETFPEGLVGIYQSFFDRLFPQRQGYDAFRPLLDVMCAAREPLTAARLADFLGRDVFDVENDLQRVAALFPERAEGRYRACHKSLTDYLRGLAGRSKTYRVNVAAGHRHIAARQLQDFRAGLRDLPVLAHLPTHLIEAGRWDDLESVLTDPEFIEAKCATGLTFALVADYNAARAAWPGHQKYDPFDAPAVPPPEWLRACTAAVLAGATDPHPDSGAGPVLRLLRAAEEQASAPPPNSPEPPVLIEMRRAEEASRAGGDPYFTASAAGRVEAFAAFVATHSHFLNQYPHELIPLARNHAASGPVAERAAALAEALARPWIARDPRPALLPTRPACLRILKGHDNAAFHVALSADGRLAVSTSHDRTVRLWDVPSGECVAVLSGPTSVRDAVLQQPLPSREAAGTPAVVRAELEALREESVKPADEGRVLSGHTGPVIGVAVTPDGRLAVSASKDATLRIWDLAARHCVRVLRGHIGNVFSVSVTPDGALAVSGGRDRSVRVWELATGQCLRTLEGHVSSVLAVSVTPDGKLAASGDYRGGVRLWDLGSGECVRAFRSLSRAVRDLALSADGRTMVLGGPGKLVRIRDVLSPTLNHILRGHTTDVGAVAVTPDGLLAVSSASDGSVRVWNALTGKAERVLHTTAVCGVSLSPGGRLAASASYDGTVRIWDVASGVGEAASGGHQAAVFSYAWSSDGRRAFSASRDTTVRVWDMESGRCLRVLRGHKSWATGVACTLDGQTVVSASWDASLRIWNLTDGSCRAVLEGHTGEVRDVALSADGRRAASASLDTTVRLWDLKKETCVKELRGHTTDVLSVALSVDGKGVVSGSWGGSVRVWDASSGECVAVLRGHKSWVTRVAIGPFGKQALSASNDRTLRLWDLEKGEGVRELHGHTGQVLDVAWAGHGGLALSAAEDGTVRAWDLESGVCRAVYYAGAEVRSVSGLWLDGRFACGTADGQMHCLTLRGGG